MNYLLIGGNGFIGSHFIDLLLEQKHSVRVFDFQMEQFRPPNTKVDYRIYPFDDIDNLENALDNIDIVIHLASATVPSNSNDKSLLEIDNILKPSITLFELLVRKNIKKIVYFSSGGAVYGDADDSNSIHEETQFRPISSYGIIKATIEYYLNLYERNYGLNSLIIRPSNPYGPRQNNKVSQGVISTFLRKKHKKEDLIIYGNLEIMKDYIYIDDLINITYKLIENDEKGAFNVGSGIGTTLNEILNIIDGIDSAKVNSVFKESLSTDVNSFVLNIKKSINSTNYAPKVHVSNGVYLTWKWIIENS